MMAGGRRRRYTQRDGRNVETLFDELQRQIGRSGPRRHINAVTGEDVEIRRSPVKDDKQGLTECLDHIADHFDHGGRVLVSDHFTIYEGMRRVTVVAAILAVGVDHHEALLRRFGEVGIKGGECL